MQREVLQKEPGHQEAQTHRDKDAVPKPVVVHGHDCEEGQGQGHPVAVQGVVLLLPAGVGEEGQVQLEALHQGVGQPEEEVEAVTEGALMLVPGPGAVPAKVPLA